VRLVGVESQDVIALRLGKAGLERAGISFAAFGDESRAQGLRVLASSVGGAAVNENYFVSEAIAIEEGMELGDEDAEVSAFVNDGQDNGNVHGGSVSMMAGGKKRYPRKMGQFDF
jgi:hypothetical protein